MSNANGQCDYMFYYRFQLSLQSTEKQVLKGHKDGSYFGSAIASVGDLTGDNIDGTIILNNISLSYPSTQTTNITPYQMMIALMLTNNVEYKNHFKPKTIDVFYRLSFIKIHVPKIIPEIAISAPYENEGRGAVYLYSGADLLKNVTTWLQRLEGDAPEQYFGLSLSPLQDYDGNGCNGELGKIKENNFT